MRKGWLIGGIAAGAVIAVFIGFVNWRAGGRPKEVDLSGIPRQGKELGLPTAPVLIEVFSDYQCYWCGHGAREFEPTVIGEYLAKGEARLRFRDYTIIGLESYWAAVAAGCAAQQDAFWPYHDRLFLEQQGENQGRFTGERLQAFAKDLGLNTEAFKRCLEQEAPAADVRADRQLGTELGVTSTPTYFVNGRRLAGIPEPGRLRRVMREELSAKR